MTMVKLNDAQMAQYIRDGYVILETGLSREFHQELFRKTDEVFEKEGNPGNNLVPRLPDVGRVLGDPALAGALASILGDDYFLEPHRHCHYNAPGSTGQELHKDSFTRRRHRTRRVLAFYYPQDTTEDMGPTAVVPGSHYYNTSEGALDAGGEVLVTVKAGAVVIANYDIWHRGTANRSDRPRYMMKFLVARMSEPGGSSANGGPAAAVDGERHVAMRRHMWSWHSGMADGNGAASGGSVDRLADVVATGPERDAIDAAYELGEAGGAAVPGLIELLDDDSGREWWEQKSSSIKGRGLTSASANASYGLTTAGRSAVPALIDRTKDAQWWLRATAAETLGDIGAGCSRVGTGFGGAGGRRGGGGEVRGRSRSGHGRTAGHGRGAGPRARPRRRGRVGAARGVAGARAHGSAGRGRGVEPRSRPPGRRPVRSRQFGTRPVPHRLGRHAGRAAAPSDGVEVVPFDHQGQHLLAL